MVEQTAKRLRPLPLELAPPEDTVKWSSVSLSEVLARGSRLEASVFDIKGKQARETLTLCRWEVVNLWSDEGLIDTAWYPTRFKRIYVDKGGVPFFLPSQLKEVYPKPLKFISEKTPTNFETIKVRENQLLLTRSGTIGSCTIVSATLKDKVFSDDVIRISPKNPTDVGYIYAFFKTEIGQTLIQTNNYGAVISHIEPEHLAEIPIPNPQALIKIEIHNLVMDSFDLRDESNELIDQAEKLLIQALELPPIDELVVEYIEPKAGFQNYNVKLSELNGRFDASYHTPITNQLLSHLTKHAESVVPLQKLCLKIIKVGMFKRNYVEKGFGAKFLGGRDILLLSPETEKYLSYKHHKSLIEGNLQLKENMLLVSARGTIGNMMIVPKHLESSVASENIISIHPSSKNVSGYLYSFLNSVYGKLLMKRETCGAVIDMLIEHDLAKLPIPLLKNKDVQQKINDLVLEANQKRYDAYLLEQKAINTINEKVIFAER